MEKEVVSILEITTQHGAIKGKTQTNKVQFYNLVAIIAVGYRVNSKQATQFRIWATKILKEYIIKGFVLVMSDSNKAQNYSAEIILTNYSKESVPFGQANEGFIKK